MLQNDARVGSGSSDVAQPAPPQQHNLSLDRQPFLRHVRPEPKPHPKCILTRPQPLPLDGQVCGLFAVDIVGFNGSCRDEDIQLYLHRSLYDMLERAFDGSGIPWHECAYEDRGDGALVVVPPTISAAGLVHPLPEKLLALVRRHNRVSCEAAQVQLRIAAHIGPVHHDGYGFVGHDVVLLCRLLDAASFKRVLRTSGAEVAFIASDYLHENIVARRPSLAGPTVFKPLMVRTKETRAHAWAVTLGGLAPITQSHCGKPCR